MRAMLLADELLRKGHKVTLLSSSFFHQRKTFRSNKLKFCKVSENLTIVLIPSSGYKKHISFERLFDHLVLSFNLYKFLKTNKSFRPDKIFIGYPPIETSFVMIQWAKKYKIPVLLDVKDNWPENFIDQFPSYLKKMARFLLSPYFRLSKYIFRNSNAITSITDSFIKWIRFFTYKKSIKANSNINYFVSPLVRKRIVMNNDNKKNSIEFWEKQGLKLYEGNHFSFVGSLSNSFDFNFIYEFSNFLISSFPDHKIVICGTGDRYEEIKLLFQNLRNTIIVGELDKHKSTILINNSIASLAPYQNTPNFKQSIPNKVIESLENSVPFITNTEGELKSMILKFNNGIFIKKSKNDFSEITKLIEDKEFSNHLRKNALKSYQSLFNFERTYQKIIYNLESI